MKYQTIDNIRLKSAMNTIYNNWFAKYKETKKLTDKQWMDCIDELKEIGAKYQSSLVDSLMRAFVDELEERGKEENK